MLDTPNRPEARVLDAMHEPRELAAADGRSAYRLLVLPSFEGPMLIRIDGDSRGWQVTGKKMSRSLVAAPQLRWSRQRVLRRHECAALEQLLAELDLWTLPVTDEVFGLDGETWMFEGKDGDQHHLIQRWCPQYIRRLPVFARLGEYLVSLARVPSPVKERWGGQWRREQLERMRSSKRDMEAQSRLHLEKMARLNEAARTLALELEARGLVCPHCMRRSRDMRFVHGRPDYEWFFFCRACGRSFTTRDRPKAPPREQPRDVESSFD